MNKPNCPRCENATFEMQLLDIQRADFKHMCVSCERCGAVVGVLDCYNIGDMLLAQNRALRAIAEKAGVSVDLPE
jgi:hypothetical protein